MNETSKGNGTSNQAEDIYAKSELQTMTPEWQADRVQQSNDFWTSLTDEQKGEQHNRAKLGTDNSADRRIHPSDMPPEQFASLINEANNFWAGLSDEDKLALHNAALEDRGRMKPISAKGEELQQASGLSPEEYEQQARERIKSTPVDTLREVLDRVLLKRVKQKMTHRKAR